VLRFRKQERKPDVKRGIHRRSDARLLSYVLTHFCFSMTETSDSKLFEAIAAGDADQTRLLLIASEFILIRVNEEEDDDENFGALTADVDGTDVLVAFTSEQTASDFISQMGEELFDKEEEIDGFVVDGETLLDYLPENFGVLIDPEHENTAVLTAELVKRILANNN
jgi:hypothetical protein